MPRKLPPNMSGVSTSPIKNAFLNTEATKSRLAMSRILLREWPVRNGRSETCPTSFLGGIRLLLGGVSRGWACDADKDILQRRLHHGEAGHGGSGGQGRSEEHTSEL